jgi:predicted MFS family arabinose efflux permease
MKKAFDLPYAITLAAVFLTGLASAGLLILKPLIVGALIDDYHFTPPEAGFVAGIEMAGIGIAAFIVAAFGGGWNRKHVILIGATLGILGSIAPITTDAYLPILLSRFIAGIGCGLIASIALAVIATTRDPDRTFGLYYMTSYIGSALMVPSGIWMMAHFHVAGAYIQLALLLSIVFFTVHRIPAAFTGLSDVSKKDVLPPFPLMAGAVSLGISLLFWIGLGGIWAFVERLGVKAGLDYMAIGAVLTMYPIASFAGALTASFLHTRLGRMPLLGASIGLAMVSIIMINWGHGLAFFTIGVLMFSYIWSLFLAYMGGAMAVLDPAGRIVAMSVASQTIGMAVGPAAAGIIAGQHGYGAIAVMSLFCFALALGMLPLLYLKMRKTAFSNNLVRTPVQAP